MKVQKLSSTFAFRFQTSALTAAFSKNISEFNPIFGVCRSYGGFFLAEPILYGILFILYYNNDMMKAGEAG